MSKRNNLYFVLALIMSVAPACGDDDDDGDDNNPADAGPDGGQPACLNGWLDPNSCTVDDSCDEPADVRLNLTAIDWITTGEGENPEIIRLIPGDASRGVFVSAAARKITLFNFDETGMTEEDVLVIETPNDTELSSVEVDPTGSYVALTRINTATTAGCVKGAVMFVDILDDPGAVLGEVPVGYNPDSSSFSKDGKWLVTADEDDREERACKPADRFGGSTTIIDLSGGPENAVVSQTIAIDHLADSEPEGVKIAPDNTVLIAIQETSELGIFNLDDVPEAVIDIVPLPAGAGPDGMVVSADGDYAVISNEYSDGFSIVDLPGGEVLSTYTIRGSGDVPTSYPIDELEATGKHEPEEVGLVTLGGAQFVLIPLQESGALISYNLTNRSAPEFDTIEHTGMNWQAEENSTEGSNIDPEGLAVFAPGGIFFVANEGEGTVTMFKTQFTQTCTE